MEIGPAFLVVFNRLGPVALSGFCVRLGVRLIGVSLKNGSQEPDLRHSQADLSK